MSGKVKAIVIGGFVLVLGGAWLGATMLTGSEIGGACNGDTDCKGMDGQCFIRGDRFQHSYCTHACTADSECPAHWTCSTLTVTSMDGSGHQTAAGTTELCTRQADPAAKH